MKQEGETMPLPVTLDAFRVQCKGYTLHLSYRLPTETIRVPLRDLTEARTYAVYVLASRLGAYRQADVFNKEIAAFYGEGVCPLSWRPDAEEESA